MDNFHIDVTSDKLKDLEAALIIAIRNTPGAKATHFKVSSVFKKTLDETIEEAKSALILCWYETAGSSKLPYSLTEKNIFTFVENWLSEQDKENYMDWEDMDGECSPKAFRIFNQYWGHINEDPYSFIAITPTYAWYGK
jgi:hypothetical protein